jgi:hypothetical protein
MPRRKVLLIGMLDSIHLARWLEQFNGSDVSLTVFPSTHFKSAHKKIFETTNMHLKVWGISLFKSFLGYFDSIITLRFLGSRIGNSMRRFYLRLLIIFLRPDVIHALEIQHAGYLVTPIKSVSERRILTNWGSDIYYFQHLPGHSALITMALDWATHYSAECLRDYELARSFGFSGVELPRIPNAGGMLRLNVTEAHVLDRNQVTVKCYGGTFGLGSMAVSVCENFLTKHESGNVFLYSVTDDLLQCVENLSLTFPGRVRFSTLLNPESHETILAELSNSRVFLGMSRSDGLSTSFLEALLFGAYPIQTNTSCAIEVIEMGAVGSIVNPDVSEVSDTLIKVFGDENLLIQARDTNQRFASDFLNYSRVAEIAKSYYVY